MSYFISLLILFIFPFFLVNKRAKDCFCCNFNLNWIISHKYSEYNNSLNLTKQNSILHLPSKKPIFLLIQSWVPKWYFFLIVKLECVFISFHYEALLFSCRTFFYIQSCHWTQYIDNIYRLNMKISALQSQCPLFTILFLQNIYSVVEVSLWKFSDAWKIFLRIIKLRNFEWWKNRTRNKSLKSPKFIYAIFF